MKRLTSFLSIRAEWAAHQNPPCNTIWTRLVQENNNMDHISTPLTTQDIDNVVKQMPADKSPGPDGFNGFFIKSCWHIIKEDFYILCFDFFNGDLDLQAINNSFITLVPKVNNPTGVNDFRPISLLNCVLKIITKLMADKVQSVILSDTYKHVWFY